LARAEVRGVCRVVSQIPLKRRNRLFANLLLTDLLASVAACQVCRVAITSQQQGDNKLVGNFTVYGETYLMDFVHNSVFITITYSNHGGDHNACVSINQSINQSIAS